MEEKDLFKLVDACLRKTKNLADDLLEVQRSITKILDELDQVNERLDMLEEDGDNY